MDWRDYVPTLMGGRPSDPTTEVIPTQQQDFPTQEDARRARSEGASYGSGLEEFLDRGKYYPQNVNGLRASGVLDAVANNIDRNRSKDSGGIADLYMGAYTAAQRNPIAALGFDPGRMGVTEGVETATNGLYGRDKDAIWFNADSPTTPVHESMHRGLQKLREAGMLTKEAENWLKTQEERFVRNQMATTYNDTEMKHLPEQYRDPTRSANIGAQQIADGKTLFDNKWGSPTFNPNASDNIPMRDEILRAAARLNARRKPALGHR